MSFIKFKRKTGEWISLYADAIRNRLRRDLNLSDLFDIAEARKNIGIIGDNNTTHYHDSRYLPKIQQLKDDIYDKLKKFNIDIKGRAEADTVNLVNNATTSTLVLKNVNADAVAIGRTTNSKNMLTAVNKFGDTEILATEQCYYDAVLNKIVLPDVLANNIVANNTITADTITANKVYNAVWNDYAELFPKGGETEPGDIIALDISSSKEQYVKSDGNNIPVGIHTSEYAMLIGGDDKKSISQNLDNYIPVALAGRVHVNFIGPAQKGAYVVPSKQKNGYAQMFDKNYNTYIDIIGILVEDDGKTGERKLKIKIKG